MITLKEFRNIYSPSEGSVEQVYVEYDFAKDGGAIEDYKAFSLEQGTIIHSLLAVATEDLTSGGGAEVALRFFIGESGQNISPALGYSNLTKYASVASVPVYSATSTLDLVEETVDTTVENVFAFPVTVNQSNASLGFAISEAALTGGKLKIKAVISKGM
jgi:hypothetical protein